MLEGGWDETQVRSVKRTCRGYYQNVVGDLDNFEIIFAKKYVSALMIYFLLAATFFLATVDTLVPLRPGRQRPNTYGGVRYR